MIDGPKRGMDNDASSGLSHCCGFVKAPEISRRTIMMKKLFAVAGMLSLFVVPVFADDAAPAAAAPAAAAPAAEAPADATAAPVAKKAKAAGMAGDEEGVKKAFDDVSAAWATGDAKAVAAFFTMDSSLINPMGMEGHGRKEVQKVIESDFAGPMKGTQQTFSDFNIRFYPQPNIALVDCTGTMTGMKKPDGTDADPMKVHVTGVVVNRSGKKWQAVLIRAYAFLTPPGAAPAADASAAPAPADAAMPADKKSDAK
jgi:uncharacterized protein (TIGR02246 family)